MRIIICILIVAFLAGCGIPTEVKEAISGNRVTISEDSVVWRDILKNSNGDALWSDYFKEHKKVCDKCEDVKMMKTHLILRSEAHLLRAMKLEEWAK